MVPRAAARSQADIAVGLVRGVGAAGKTYFAALRRTIAAAAMMSPAITTLRIT